MTANHFLWKSSWSDLMQSSLQSLIEPVSLNDWRRTSKTLIYLFETRWRLLLRCHLYIPTRRKKYMLFWQGGNSKYGGKWCRDWNNFSGRDWYVINCSLTHAIPGKARCFLPCKLRFRKLLWITNVFASWHVHALHLLMYISMYYLVYV